MFAFRPTFVFVCCLLCSTVLVAQESSSSAAFAAATSDPRATALLQSSLVALIGGGAVNDVTLTGTARRIAGSNDETGTAELVAMSPAYSKVSLNFPSGPRIEIRNPSGSPLPGVIPANAPQSAHQPQPVVAWSGTDGVLHPVTANNLLTDATWFFPAYTVGRLSAPQNYILSYIGQETLGGQAVLHISAIQQFPGLVSVPSGISLLMQHLSQINIYFDPTTFLPVALIFDTHSDNNALLDTPTEIRFSGYRTASGVQVPFRVQKYVNNGLVLDLQFSKVALNSGQTADQFELQ